MYSFPRYQIFMLKFVKIVYSEIGKKERRLVDCVVLHTRTIGLTKLET